MSSTVVHVKNISHQTSDKEVRDFFSFCGKITSLSVTPTSAVTDSPKSATVTFEKESAAKTALLLDSTQLGPSQVHVSAASNIDDIASSAGHQATGAETDEELSQDDKPRSRIVAEYLAHGYVLSDSALQKAIALDKQHGVSARFTNALTTFDQKFKATDKAKGIDASYAISDKAVSAWNSLSSYFEKALETPTGQKVAAFYTQGDKQVRDIHAEARRLADLKAGKTGQHEKTGTGVNACACGYSDGGDCNCVKGEKCSCACCNSASTATTTGLGEGTATGKADAVLATSNIAPASEKH